VRVLRDQTGAKYGGIRKALVIRQANYGGLRYEIVARDATLSLKEFGLRVITVRKKGKTGRTYRTVSAAPWGVRRRFNGAWPGPGGHAYKRTSAERLPIKKLWGPSIPKEMVKGASEAAFYAVVRAALPERLAHELYRVLPG
jgi:hypothetical protein